MSQEPATRRLVLVRHGRTAWNLERRAQGQADVPLDAVGREEARAAAPYLARMAPARLWSSDLSRAAETAAAVSRASGLPVTYDARLRECDVGIRSGFTLEEFATAHPQAHAAWRDGRPVPGEETEDDMRARVVPALQDAAEALEPGETGVLVMHGWCARVAAIAFLGWPPEVNTGLRGMDNCGWAILADSGRGGLWRLESWNETATPGPHQADFASDAPVG